MATTISDMVGSAINSVTNSARSAAGLAPKAGTPSLLTNGIIGLPMAFNSLADPNYRVFKDVFVNQAPIINIIPGRPNYKSGSLRTLKDDYLKGLTVDDDNSARAGLWADDSIVPTPNKDYYKEEGKEYDYSGELLERDLRFYSFETDFYEYRKIVNLLLNEVGSKMTGFALGDTIDSYINFSNSHSTGLHFYCEGSSTVSESASNEVSESSLAGKTKGISDQAREQMFIAGETFNETGNRANIKEQLAKSSEKNGSVDWTSLGMDLMATAGQAVGTAGQLTNDPTTAIAALMAGGSNINAGEHLMFPKIWRNSTFDKSYNLQFKFVSPYGDSASIYEYVYLPFLMLMALAFPRQQSPDSYKAPMLMRLDCPGYFNADMAMVTNFSFVKGGSNNLWTPGNLPLAIDVTMTVTDLYPTLSVASNYRLLKQNIGLSAFLDNMCGLNVNSLNLAANIKSSIAQKTAIFAGAEGDIITKAKDAIENYGVSGFSKIFFSK
jgi:hypothetical protein